MERMRSALRTAALVVAMSGGATPSHAQSCWVVAEHPKTADNLAASDPRVAPMRATAQRIHAILRANTEFASLPEARLRSRWQIGGQSNLPGNLPARSLWFQARDHRREMWAAGECGIHPQAERIEPRASVVVQVNAPTELFNGQPELRDDRLTAWKAPQAKEEIAGRPVYHGWMLVFTSNGRPPWVLVTQAEYLDFVEREIARQRAEVEANHRQLERMPSQDEMTRNVYENLRKINPAEAEKFLELQRQQAAAPGRKGPDRSRDLALFDQRLASVRAFRSSLSAETLAGPAHLGWTGERPESGPNGPQLARLDPAFPWDARNPQRPQIVAVSVLGNGPYEAAMDRVRRTIDWSAFEALVR